MKKRIFHLANFSLLIGAALVGYVVRASLQHTMNWAKLVLFWSGCGAIVLFMGYHLLARSPETWQGRPIRRYSLLHRAAFAVLLIGGLFAATKFSYRTWQIWQQPALFWEPIDALQTAPDRFEAHLAIGNQRFYHAIALQELQLNTLSDPPAREKTAQVTLRIDSLQLALEHHAGNTPRFGFAPALPIPPLERREFHFNFHSRATPAIYQLNALYGEDGADSPSTQKHDQYILLEDNQAAWIGFAELLARARQPSHHQQGVFIHALGRSRHPQALAELLRFLQVHDMRIQVLTCEALAMLGDAGAAPELIALAKASKNPSAFRALGELPSRSAVDFLIEVLESEEEAFLRAEAAEALGRIAVLNHGKFDRAIPTLVSVLRYSSSEDAMVQREAMLALARISDSLAVPAILEYAEHRHSGQALRNLLEVTVVLGDEWLLPSLGMWLQDWRSYNLDLNDLQLLLNYLVVTQHRDMIQVLIETLDLEISPEAQAKIVDALFKLTGHDFGELQHPVLDLATEKSNRQILQRWQKWWKQAQQDSLFREQIKPIG